MSNGARSGDGEPRDSKLQGGAAHAKERCGSVGAANLFGCLLKSGDDFLSFRVPKSCSQIPVAVIADWRLFSKEMPFFRRQAENRIARNDDRTFDDVLQFTYIARPHVTHQRGHGLWRDSVDALAHALAELPDEVVD